MVIPTDRRYPKYRGCKIEIINNQHITVNATNIGEVFNSDPKTYLTEREALKYMYDYGKFRLNPSIGRSLKARSHYRIVNVYYRNGIQRKTYYFQKNLALRYATWLNLDFGVWLFDQIDDILSEKKDRRFWDWEKKLYY